MIPYIVFAIHETDENSLLVAAEEVLNGFHYKLNMLREGNTLVTSYWGGIRITARLTNGFEHWRDRFPVQLEIAVDDEIALKLQEHVWLTDEDNSALMVGIDLMLGLSGRGEYAYWFSGLGEPLIFLPISESRDYARSFLLKATVVPSTAERRSYAGRGGYLMTAAEFEFFTDVNRYR